MEVIKFVLFTLLLMAAWRYVILPTSLDAARDQLFDIRDELRKEFLSKGWDISSDKYGETRSVVNSYLRFTEQTTFWKLFYIQYVVMRDRAESAPQLEAKSVPVSSASSADVDQYVSNLRRRALGVVMGYAASSSFFLNLIAVIMLPFFLVFKITKIAGGGVQALFSAVAYAFKRFPELVISYLLLLEQCIGDFIFNESVVDEYSKRYRYVK